MGIINRAEIQTFLGKGSSFSDAELGLAMLLRPAVEAAVSRFLGFRPDQRTLTEFYPDIEVGGRGDGEGVWDTRNGRAFEDSGRGQDSIILRGLPVRSITSVYEDPSAYAGQASNAYGASTVLIGGVDYYLDIQASGFCWTGKLVRITGAWSNAPRSVKVTYVAGLSDDELAADYADIKLATLVGLAKQYNEVKSNQPGTGRMAGAIVAERLADYSVQYDSAAAKELSGFSVRLPKTVLQLLEPYRRLDFV